jgi:hypothetical protein
MPILGLVHTESVANQRFTNIRRQVFYFYPNGAFPLAGLLSMIKTDPTNDAKFSWWEKRLLEQRSTTVSTANGPFQDENGGNIASPFNMVVGTVYRIKVASTDLFRVGHVFRCKVDITGGTGDAKGIITSLAATPYITFRALTALTAVLNGNNENNAKEVLVIGSAYAQGRTLSGIGETYNLPVNIENYTQIFRTKFTFTGSSLDTSLKFDKTGPYKDKAKEHSVNHMIEMEQAILEGERGLHHVVEAINPDTGAGLPTYTSGGILWFLKLWEDGSTYGNTAATLDTDDNKRIITNSGGSLNEKTYDKYLERVFRVTNSTSNEKLCVCGSGFLQTVNQMYRSKSTLNASLPLDDTYGMNVVAHETPFGTIYYKTHPLFSQNAVKRYNALFVDMGNLRWRVLGQRDTKLLKNLQPNDADYRMDEWRGEGGLELRFPESFMYLQNVQDYTP